MARPKSTETTKDQTEEQKTKVLSARVTPTFHAEAERTWAEDLAGGVPFGKTRADWLEYVVREYMRQRPRKT